MRSRCTVSGDRVNNVGLPPAQALAAFDFWIGRWSVRLRSGERAGTNLVERVLDGYAVLEHWRGATGDEGKSFFYYDGSVGRWKQVWAMHGFVKLKELVEVDDSRLRFEGQALVHEGRFPDRTTLTSLGDGTVSQLIEHSLDGGESWTTSFDAIYEPAD
jgi:hypothetical protein